MTIHALPIEGAVVDLSVHSAPPGYAGDKSDELLRLRKIEGQIRGVIRMVDQDRYCIDVLTQISAVTRALQAVALSLLDDHIRHCVVDATRTDAVEGEAKLDELTSALRRALRV
jgi:DNA-binding FrmR family transcriptional regulator